MELDELHKKIDSLYRMTGPCRKVDDLLNQCTADHGECHICSQIVCPSKDPLHFHHDGCPSCSEPMHYTAEQVDEMNLNKD